MYVAEHFSYVSQTFRTFLQVLGEQGGVNERQQCDLSNQNEAALVDVHCQTFPKRMRNVLNIVTLLEESVDIDQDKTRPTNRSQATLVDVRCQMFLKRIRNASNIATLLEGKCRSKRVNTGALSGPNRTTQLKLAKYIYMNRMSLAISCNSQRSRPPLPMSSSTPRPQYTLPRTASSPSQDSVHQTQATSKHPNANLLHQRKCSPQQGS